MAGIALGSQNMQAAALRRGVELRNHSLIDTDDSKDAEAALPMTERTSPLSVSAHVMQIAAMVSGRVPSGGAMASEPQSASEKGVANQRIVVSIVLCWYLVSFLGIVLNKHMLSSESPVDPRHLALVQTITTVLMGGIMQARHRRDPAETATGGDKMLCGRSWRKVAAIGLLGLLRFLTIVFGLISLKHVAASFTETVKASGPFFTVVAAYLLLGERTSFLRLASLVPVVGGLMLASATELSFTTTGFVAALLTNTTECIQNVFCKQLLSPTASSSEAPYTAQQLQYYSAIAALMVQIPVLLLHSWDTPAKLDMDQTIQLVVRDDNYYNHTMMLLLWNGMLYYAQSALAYMVMSYYSPVTVAVLNTAKRAMIICGTAIVFRNQLRVATQAGTIVCISGAYLYNHFGGPIASQTSRASSKPTLCNTPSSPKELHHLRVESQSDDEIAGGK